MDEYFDDNINIQEINKTKKTIYILTIIVMAVGVISIIAYTILSNILITYIKALYGL